jgi:uncharacterized protein
LIPPTGGFPFFGGRMTLYPSKYNHLVQLEDNKKNIYILSNLFIGAADLIEKELFDTFKKAENIGVFSPPPDFSKGSSDYFIKKGYLYPNTDEEEKLIRAISENYKTRDKIAAGLKGGQYGFITSLNCNLACPYCFQQKKADSVGFLSRRQVDLGLDSIRRAEELVEAIMGESSLPKISITGGEPLLRHRSNLEVLDYLLSRLEDLQWPYNITTNGTELKSFVEEHARSDRCRNIQVTLDGPREIHDQRRCYRGGGPSFDRICEGVDAALSEGWYLTLRVCLDMSNVKYLPELAEFIIDKRWPEHDVFNAYVSPVTDHGSICGDIVPRDEADLLDELLDLVAYDPVVLDVFDIKHFRGFNYVDRLLIQKNPRFPVIFRCEAVTGMYIFDPLGDIHVCLEAVGDPSLRIGSYDPTWQIDEEAFTRWTKRTALTVPQCKECKVRFLCAGGCTMESFNKEDSEVCMPFLREIETSWKYFGKTKPELFV